MADKNYVQVNIRLTLAEHAKLVRMATKQKYPVAPQTVATLILKAAIADAR